MKIKTKLNIGVGLLFLMIMALSVISGWYINQLKRDTNNILVANYNTLQYSRSMLLALEEINSDPLAFQVFEKHLDKQKKNVTEPGEKEATENVSTHFEALKKNRGNLAILSAIRKDVAELMQLNMVAIEHKSSVADATAKKRHHGYFCYRNALFCDCFYFADQSSFQYRKPHPDPDGKASGRLPTRITKSAFILKAAVSLGQLANSFNTMAEKLHEYSESKLDKIIQGKKRIEILIDSMTDPVIGIDENKKVLFVNDEALKITGLKKENFVGKLIQDVAVTNDLIRDIIKEIIQGTTANLSSEPMKIYADGKESYFEKEIIDINMIPTGEQQKQDS